jgi:hypothetical protein
MFDCFQVKHAGVAILHESVDETQAKDCDPSDIDPEETQGQDCDPSDLSDNE